MSVQRTVVQLSLLSLSALVLLACGSAGRNSSPNYHINTMERMDKNAHYPMDERTRRMEKALDRDK